MSSPHGPALGQAAKHTTDRDQPGRAQCQGHAQPPAPWLYNTALLSMPTKQRALPLNLETRVGSGAAARPRPPAEHQEGRGSRDGRRRDSQVGAAPGGHHVEHREGVDDEAQLLVREQGVGSHEAQHGQGQHPRPPVHHAQGHKEKAAAQAPGQGRVEVPQQRGGLPPGLRRPREGERAMST